MAISSAEYMNRPGEFLVLEGIRRFSNGLNGNLVSDWVKVRRLFDQNFTGEVSQIVRDSFFSFARQLHLSSRCCLVCNPVGCPALNLHEAMVLGLVSGLQHNEDTAVAVCLDVLTKGRNDAAVLNGAEAFAVSLRACRVVMIPVPTPTIRAIISDQFGGGTLQ